jgi:Cdc6-like AAA superfamily ATPase
MTTEPLIDDEAAAIAAISAFEREVGLTKVPARRLQAGNRQFIKFRVGRQAPLYTYALHKAQLGLSQDNSFRGTLGLEVTPSKNFPNSLEASALLTLLTRSTREVSQDSSSRGYTVPYIPFQNREDHQLSQPASHIVKGRRGVGKSTLIRRAVELLSATSALVAVLDMQVYSNLAGEDLQLEVLQDVCQSLAESAGRIAGAPVEATGLLAIAEKINKRNIELATIPPAIKRALRVVTQKTNGHAFVFLDDFHLVDEESQSGLLHILHGALKGSNGWLKVSGLSSLLNTYSAKTRQGLQVPGDAQVISLDLTLENPEAAERHLRAILSGFLHAVGYTFSDAVIPDAAFRRLAWATAGVPRDFLQMFARAVEHAQRNRHSTVTLSDVNIAIGEFGQQKLDDLLRDARNEADTLKNFLGKLETLCLDKEGVNAFLVRSEDSRERDLIHALSDLRMVHLIHQSITPDKAGERYEAYIIDYSIFTGFRRRRNIREMVPAEAQFKASELRALPKVLDGFIEN